MAPLDFQGVDSIWLDVVKCEVAGGIFSLLVTSAWLWPSDIVEVPATDTIELEHHLVAGLTGSRKAGSINNAPLIVIAESASMNWIDASGKN